MSSRISKTEPRGAFPASSLKYNPLRHIRYLYTTFVQGLFANACPGNYQWRANLEDTEIVIMSESPLKLETLNDRPGITFTRAPVAFSHMGFDDMLRFDAQTGRKTKGVLIPGTMVINCCSRNDLESEYLAWIVSEHLWLLRDLLMKAGFYDVGRNLQISAPSKGGDIVAGDQSDEWFCTSIQSPFHFQRTSEFTPLDQTIIRDVRLRLGLDTPPLIALPAKFPSAPGSPDFPAEIDVLPPSPAVPGMNPNVRREDNLAGLPLVPHPLNPAVLVKVRTVGANSPTVRHPGIGMRVLPISGATVEQSGPQQALTAYVKV